MEISIGVTYTPKEIQLELDGSTSPDALKATVNEALTTANTLWLQDSKGRQIGVPADKIAYVEIGSETASRPIGFG